MSEKQKTIKQEVSFSGIGLHTGEQVELCLKPAKDNEGITFVRVDLPGKPVIQPSDQNISSDQGIPRCTAIGEGNVVVHTVEHLMGALYGLGIDNLVVEINGNELPGLDGSSCEFFEKIQKSGVVELQAEKQCFFIKEPICVENNGSSILVVPDDEFKISYTLNYDHPLLQAQFFSITVTQETLGKEIAPCRTFCLEEEAEELQANGLGKGANYANTLVVGEKGVIENELKFDNEFARHKVLDLIGDLYLLGKPIRGRVFAVRSGHQLNIDLLKKIFKQQEQYDKQGFIPQNDFDGQKELDIHQVMKILPHRYPFLFVDRILELRKGEKAVGIKNVTINDNFFCGHFPEKPVMPGVLMVEAMAQVGGVLLLTNGNHDGKVALFMAVDNVKFRKVVEPGDQLVMEVTIVRDRSRSAAIRGEGKVAGNVVVEADMMFSFLDASYLNG